MTRKALPGRVILTLSFAACSIASAADLTPPGVHNFHQVDEHIYRGAQPLPAGFKSLAKLGVKTVIDLRGGKEHTAEEEGLVKAAGMRYIHIPLGGYSAPTDEEITKILGILNDSGGWPVFVHCRRGADRTGTVVACYRISHDHWQNEKALTEARLHGMSWTERAMQHYILRYNAGANPPPPPLGKSKTDTP
ncbi:MAG TPA: protein tyrosine phosphatase family protein [Bryobacteraceae bacterium]|nr:protein tyrosine phosphatase family protein [Bryobacteraceae bacterium]